MGTPCFPAAGVLEQLLVDVRAVQRGAVQVLMAGTSARAGTSPPHIFDAPLVATFTDTITGQHRTTHVFFNMEHLLTSLYAEQCSALHRLLNRETPVTSTCHRTVIGA